MTMIPQPGGNHNRAIRKGGPGMRFFQFWRDVPFFRKMMIILGTLMGLMWIIVFYNMFQLGTLANKSTRIMRQYNEITGFINAISREDSCMEAFVRPSHTSEDEIAYVEAASTTDERLKALLPNLGSDARQEYMLKQAITNAMTHYRQDRNALLDSPDYYERVRLFVLLQRQNIYLNRYGLELLQFRMREGERSWDRITATNRTNTRVTVALMVAATCVTVFCLYLLIRTMLRPLLELGDERSTIEQCQFGGLDFTRVSSGAAAELAPLMNAMQMPYLYNDVDHLFEVMDGEIGQEVFDTLENNNLVGITYIHPCSRNFFNAKKEIHTPADMAGMKIRVSESDLMLNLMSNLGAAGVGLPFYLMMILVLMLMLVTFIPEVSMLIPRLLMGA